MSNCVIGGACRFSISAGAAEAKAKRREAIVATDFMFATLLGSLGVIVDSRDRVTELNCEFTEINTSNNRGVLPFYRPTQAGSGTGSSPSSSSRKLNDLVLHTNG
jgi:hypothetical protein